MQNNKETFVLSDGGTVADLTRWEKFDALTDAQVIAAALSDPDAQPLTEDQLSAFRRVADVPGANILEKSRALTSRTKNKQLVSIRCDKDVIAFFRAQGKGYQSLMNNILRSYMEKHDTRRRPPRDL